MGFPKMVGFPNNFHGFSISTGVPDSLPAVGLPPGLSVSINPESYSEGMFSWQGHLDR